MTVLCYSCKKEQIQNKIESFEIYGRSNPLLNDSSKIMLSYTTDEETFMSLDDINEVNPKMKRIHKNIHLQSFPEIFTTNKKINTLSFTDLPYSNSTEINYIHKIFTFYNTNNYNDLIVYYHPIEKIDQLAHVYNIKTTPDFVLYTINYNDNHEDLESNQFKQSYILDKKRKAYINKLNYVTGEENATDYDYNNTNLLFIYKKIKRFNVINKEILIDNESVL